MPAKETSKRVDCEFDPDPLYELLNAMNSKLDGISKRIEKLERLVTEINSTQER